MLLRGFCVSLVRVSGTSWVALPVQTEVMPFSAILPEDGVNSAGSASLLAISAEMKPIVTEVISIPGRGAIVMTPFSTQSR